MKKINVLLSLVLCLGSNISYSQFRNIATFGDYRNSIMYDGEYSQGMITYYANRIYGMTNDGGTNGYGSIFCVDTNGNRYRDLFAFNSTNGKWPTGRVIISGHKIYGMTSYGGTQNKGVIFSVDTNGSNYKILVELNDTTGIYPNGGLTLVGNRLFGMTEAQGYYLATQAGGTLFCLDTNGTGFTVLHYFALGTNDGWKPYGDLILLRNRLYGTTATGSFVNGNNAGTIFYIDTNGTNYNVVVEMGGPNFAMPATPHGDLTVVGNKFFGLTTTGGINNDGAIFYLDTNGTGYDSLVSFSDSTGIVPHGALTLVGNKLYGLAESGGASSYGTIFSVDTTINTPNLTRLYSFSKDSGSTPFGTLLLSGGALYGTTTYNGSDFFGVGAGFGTIFKWGKNLAGVNNISDNNSESVKLHPNPNNGSFQLDMRNFQAGMKYHVEVYNVLGEKIYSTAFNIQNSTFNISLSGNSPGMYMYRVLSADNELIGSGKFVIQ